MCADSKVFYAHKDELPAYQYKIEGGFRRLDTALIHAMIENPLLN